MRADCSPFRRLLASRPLASGDTGRVVLMVTLLPGRSHYRPG